MSEIDLETAAGNWDEQARQPLRVLLDDYERRLILEALEASQGHRRRAASALGLLPTTLHEKMKRLGIWHPARAPQPAVGPESPVGARD
jgi:two-component system nitrogen regulation response regulator GlnG